MSHKDQWSAHLSLPFQSKKKVPSVCEQAVVVTGLIALRNFGVVTPSPYLSIGALFWQEILRPENVRWSGLYAGMRKPRCIIACDKTLFSPSYRGVKASRDVAGFVTHELCARPYSSRVALETVYENNAVEGVRAGGSHQ